MADFGAIGVYAEAGRGSPISAAASSPMTLRYHVVSLRTVPKVATATRGFTALPWVDDYGYNPLLTPATATLSGVVTQGGLPAPRSHVYLHKRANGQVIQHQRANDVGAFTFVDLHPNTSLYFVTAVNPDYSPQPLHVVTGDAAAVSVLGGSGGGGPTDPPATRAFGFLAG